MTVCTTKAIEFSRCKRRKVQAQFCGGEITSDGGVMLLREADRRLKLTERIAPLLPDPRVKSKVIHRMLPLLRQRIYGLALGYEDLNDHGTLRIDPAIQTAVGRDESLASSPTLCRFENWAGAQSCWEISRQLVEMFIESSSAAPAEVILDFDSTDDLVHGDQPAGGMKQRVSVARAFANDPEILLLDEPFGALDEQNRLLLQQELLKIWEGMRKTAVFITHSIDEALCLGDRIMIMTAHPGRIKHIVQNDLPRPRDISAIWGSPEYHRLLQEIWGILRAEVLKGKEQELSCQEDACCGKN